MDSFGEVNDSGSVQLISVPGRWRFYVGNPPEPFAPFRGRWWPCGRIGRTHRCARLGNRPARSDSLDGDREAVHSAGPSRPPCRAHHRQDTRPNCFRQAGPSIDHRLQFRADVRVLRFNCYHICYHARQNPVFPWFFGGMASDCKNANSPHRSRWRGRGALCSVSQSSSICCRRRRCSGCRSAKLCCSLRSSSRWYSSRRPSS